MTSEFFGRQRECRFYTAGCGNKMAVSVNGPRAVNESGGPVTPGMQVVVILAFQQIPQTEPMLLSCWSNVCNAGPTLAQCRLVYLRPRYNPIRMTSIAVQTSSVTSWSACWSNVFHFWTWRWLRRRDGVDLKHKNNTIMTWVVTW